MTRKEFYESMRALFVKCFGEDFKEHRLEIKKRLKSGEAPEINELYQSYTYRPGVTRHYAHFRPRMYNLWDYDRMNKLWKHL